MTDTYSILFFILLVTYRVSMYIYSTYSLKNAKYIRKLTKYLNKQQYGVWKHNIMIGYPSCKVFEQNIIYKKGEPAKVKQYTCYNFNIKDSIIYCNTKNIIFQDKNIVLINRTNSLSLIVNYTINESDKIIIYNKKSDVFITKYSNKRVKEIIRQHDNDKIIKVLFVISYFIHVTLLSIFFVLSDLLNENIILKTFVYMISYIHSAYYFVNTIKLQY